MTYDPTKDNGDAQRSTEISSQARNGEPVTPSDTVDVPTYYKAVYVGSFGDIKVLPVNNSDSVPITLANFTGFLPCQVRRIYATGTTAAGIVGFWG